MITIEIYIELLEDFKYIMMTQTLWQFSEVVDQANNFFPWPPLPTHPSSNYL